MSSRYDPRDEPADYLDGDDNARCADCGAGFYRSAWDRCHWCSACADTRDRWAEAQAMRSILKAVLKVDLSKVKDVA